MGGEVKLASQPPRTAPSQHFLHGRPEPPERQSLVPGRGRGLGPGLVGTDRPKEPDHCSAAQPLGT